MTANGPLSLEYTSPPSTLEDLPDLVDFLTHIWDLNPIVLWDLNVNIESQNSCSNQVSELMMKFGLVEFRYNSVSAGGSGTERRRKGGTEDCWEKGEEMATW